MKTSRKDDGSTFFERLCYELLVLVIRKRFVCTKCDWEGTVISHPDRKLISITYCPYCSDQR
jgi:hypothetical protein